MRTTVELADELRADLIRIAVARGQKGFSAVLEEAVRFYLAHESKENKDERLRAILALEGSITEEAAEEMRERVAEMRGRPWRSS